ncbi:N-acetyltransferase [Tychonema sp. BBK16]|uniref:GNAT family N-acetyltransferase n=1 Tax=Tychonema sp. BBK16 TaxID=2699888 RepID=UPI001F2B32F8|nr:GNAT family N-acetyltransferase [Tychonema sp. BBK16]MCF6372172.1 GNAT family N-acetyltransferase [Tychonema sp. BBK16]
METADEAGFSRTLLMVLESGEAKVCGFYTLSASTIPVKELPDEYKQPLPFSIPAILVGQFAIDKVWQGQGISRLLLADAYRRICLLFEQEIIGFQAIRIDTRNEEAKAFWLKQGFVPSRKTQRSLFLPVRTILRELEM